jgi:uncharacterized protein YndB with AHSA1/START domain
MHAPDGNITAMVGGTYYEVHPPERLVFSWVWEAPEPEASETLVTVELYEVEGETEITVTHEYLDDPTEPPQHTIGWNCSLERLTQLVEAGALHRVFVAQSGPCHQ